MRGVLVPTAVVLGMIGLVSGQTDGPTNEPTQPQPSPDRFERLDRPERLDSLIEQLGHPDYRKRQAASHALAEHGNRATAALHRASEHPNPEVAARARELLQRLAVDQRAVDGAPTPGLASPYAGLLRIYHQTDRLAAVFADWLATRDWSPPVRSAYHELRDTLTRLDARSQPERVEACLQTLMRDRQHGFVAVQRLVEAVRSAGPDRLRSGVHALVLAGQAIALELEPSRGVAWLEYLCELACRADLAYDHLLQQIALWHQFNGTTERAMASASRAFRLNRNAPRHHPARVLPAQLLVWLHWSRGDMPQSLHWVGESGLPHLARDFALRYRDWPRYRALQLEQTEPARAQIPPPDGRRANDPLHATFGNVSHAAHLLLLEGNQPAAQRLVEQLRNAKSDAGLSVPIVHGLLRCERPDLALAVAWRDCHPAVAWPIYQSRLQLDEAQVARVDLDDEIDPHRERLVRMLEVVPRDVGTEFLLTPLLDANYAGSAVEIGNALKNYAASDPADQTERLRLLRFFSHRVDPETLWAHLNDWAKAQVNVQWSGLNHSALHQLGHLYPRYSPETVVAVWEYYWKDGGSDNPERCLRRLDEVLSAVNPGKQGIELAHALLAKREQFNAPTQMAMVLAAAELAQQAGDPKLADEACDVFLARPTDKAQTLLESAVKLGLYYLRRGQCQRAARCFEQARYNAHTLHALGVYLHALALEKAGQRGESERLYQMARLIDAPEQRLIPQLWQLGLVESARREYQLAGHRFWQHMPYTHELPDVFRFLASQGDFLRAAESLERAIAAASSGESCGPLSSLVQMTLLGHYRALRARHHFAAGRVDAGWAEAQRCLSVCPGSVEHASRFIVELERLDRPATATRLYLDVLDRYTQQLALYPESAWLHARVAWLCASTGRDPERALNHARQAVKLAPRWDRAHLALAEALWAAGDRPQARQVARVAGGLLSALEWNARSFGQQQLRRYESEQASEPAEGFEELL